MTKHSDEDDGGNQGRRIKLNRSEKRNQQRENKESESAIVASPNGKSQCYPLPKPSLSSPPFSKGCINNRPESETNTDDVSFKFPRSKMKSYLVTLQSLWQLSSPTEENKMHPQGNVVFSSEEEDGSEKEDRRFETKGGIEYSIIGMSSDNITLFASPPPSFPPPLPPEGRVRSRITPENMFLSKMCPSKDEEKPVHHDDINENKIAVRESKTSESSDSSFEGTHSTIKRFPVPPMSFTPTHFPQNTVGRSACTKKISCSLVLEEEDGEKNEVRDDIEDRMQRGGRLQDELKTVDPSFGRRSDEGKSSISFHSQSSYASSQSKSSYASSEAKSPGFIKASITRKTFFSTVARQSTYLLFKRSQSWTWRNIIRKSVGIPLAIAYHFLLVWIISTFILGKSGNSEETSIENLTRSAKNICDTVLLTKNVESTNTDSSSTLDVYFQQNHDTISNMVNDFKHTKPISAKLTVDNNQENSTHRNSNTRKTDNISFEEDLLSLHVTIGAVMAMIGIYSIFSRNIRATMLLLLPGLITNRSRHVIFTIILGMLANGPVTTIQENLRKLMDDSACMYMSVVAIGCIKETEGRLILMYAKHMYESFIKLWDIVRNMHCTFSGKSCSGSAYDPFPYTGNMFDDMEKSLHPSTQGIKALVTVLVEKAERLGDNIDIARKLLTIASVLMLIIDAVRYLQSYYTDSSFDNMHISEASRRYWRSKDYYRCSEVLKTYSFAAWDEKKGLRHWEINDGYKTLNLPKCSVRLCYKILRNSISIVVFTILISFVLLTDYLLTATLEHIREDENFHITLEGFRRNITADISAELRNYNTKSCLATPHYTSKDTICLVSLLMLVAIFSCVLQVFLSGIRAKLCAVFYPDRVRERADYLYFRLVSGRMSRKCELLMLVRREVERREKLVHFSPLQRFRRILSSFGGIKGVKVACPGCKHKMKETEMKNLCLEMVGKTVGTKICGDCELDLSSKYKCKVETNL